MPRVSAGSCAHCDSSVVLPHPAGATTTLSREPDVGEQRGVQPSPAAPHPGGPAGSPASPTINGAARRSDMAAPGRFDPVRRVRAGSVPASATSSPLRSATTLPPGWTAAGWCAATPSAATLSSTRPEAGGRPAGGTEMAAIERRMAKASRPTTPTRDLAASPVRSARSVRASSPASPCSAASCWARARSTPTGRWGLAILAAVLLTAVVVERVRYRSSVAASCDGWAWAGPAGGRSRWPSACPGSCCWCSRPPRR